MPLMLGVVATEGQSTQPYWITQTSYPNSSTLRNQTGAAVAYDIGLNTYMATKVGTQNILVVKQGTRADIIWAKQINTGISLNYVTSLAVDASQNVYVTAFVLQTGYMWKLDSTGAIVWSRSFTVTGGQTNFSMYPFIKFDSGGNIIAMMNQSTSTTQSGVEIIKINPSTGAIIWQQRYYHTNTSTFITNYGTAFDLDSSDNIYASVLYLDPSTSFYKNGVVKFNSSGVPQWHTTFAPFNTSNANVTYAVAAAPDGSIYAVGPASSTISANSMRFIKMNSSGTIVWNTTVAVPASANLQTLSANCDSNSNLYAVYYYVDASGNKITQYIKWDTATATINWQRSMNMGLNNAGLAQRPSVLNNTKSFLMTAYNFTGTNNYENAALVKIPLNGTKTGTYNLQAIGWIYAASSLTTAAESLSQGSVLQTYTTGNILLNTLTNPTVATYSGSLASVALP